MKKITIIGASGYVGTAILNEALIRGYEATAIVRHPERILIQDSHLKILPGDVRNEDEIARLTEGTETVISAYNPGWSDPAIYDDLQTGYKALLAGVKKAGVKRLLIAGGAGTLQVNGSQRVMDEPGIPPHLLPGIKGIADVYYHLLLPEKELDWVYFSPAANLEPGQRTGNFRLGKDKLIIGKDGESRISIEDYALAMIDEAENKTHHRERFTIGY